jgi:peptide/nickel transport system permease protein
MSRFVIRRLLGAIPLLFGMAILSFMFAQPMPGGSDTLYARAGRMTPQQLENILYSHGFDQPI